MLKEEKKVEYLELIYDLIFVYVIGRNSSLLRNVVDGFVPAGTVIDFSLTTSLFASAVLPLKQPSVIASPLAVFCSRSVSLKLKVFAVGSGSLPAPITFFAFGW